MSTKPGQLHSQTELVGIIQDICNARGALIRLRFFDA
jgi:hypothetical protein